MTLDELKQMQHELGLRNNHLVHIGHEQFTIAHTDTERASEEPLEQCPLHQWLESWEYNRVATGVYIARLTPTEWKLSTLRMTCTLD